MKNLWPFSLKSFIYTQISARLDCVENLTRQRHDRDQTENQQNAATVATVATVAAFCWFSVWSLSCRCRVKFSTQSSLAEIWVIYIFGWLDLLKILRILAAFSLCGPSLIVCLFILHYLSVILALCFYLALLLIKLHLPPVIFQLIFAPGRCDIFFQDGERPCSKCTNLVPGVSPARRDPGKEVENVPAFKEGEK